LNNQSWITSKAQIQGEWKPRTDLKLKDFLEKQFSQISEKSFSTLLLASEIKTQSLQHVSQMEKARFLPRVGLFAQNNIYSGRRDTESSQSYGVYLMWELFNADSYKRPQEARAKSMAAESKIRSAKIQENLARQNLATSRLALEKNLKLLEDTNSLLSEQTRNAMKLFNSGLLNALQLAEVLNRRVDVVEQKNTAELSYLDVRSQLNQLTH